MRRATSYNKDLKKYNDRKHWNKKYRKNVSGIAVLFVVLLAVIICLITYFIKSRIPVSPKPVINSSYSQSSVAQYPETIPDFFGEDYIVLNNNMPNFNEYDIANISGESYAELDELGRCGAAVACIDFSMMPAQERKYIGMIRPSGWSQAKYEGIVDSDPPYLFNRCHLIAHALTGQNSNERNLITGTRYMNASIMLPFETEVMEYLDHSENHVIYRVTPFFKDNELVARGIEMEAYSIEDNGAGVCFHVFIYNYQPMIVIDYHNGDSYAE